MEKNILKGKDQKRQKKRTRFLVQFITLFIITCGLSLPAFSATPIISSVSPDREFNNISTDATITGENFEQGARVSLLNAGPTSLGSVDTPGSTEKVHVSGNYAYVADGTAGIQIIDISDPANPELKGSYDTGDASSIYVSGNYAYVGDWNDTLLHIIDISDPEIPVRVSSTFTYGNVRDIVVIGNYAYLAADALITFDVNNPGFPSIADMDDTIWAEGIHASGNYLYIADYYGLQIYSLSNPRNPSFKGKYDIEGEWPLAVHVSGNYAYVTNDDTGLHIINVSDPVNPEFAGYYNMPSPAWDVFVSDNYAYVAQGSSEIQVFDVNNPASLRLTGSYDTPGFAGAINVSGNYMYVADGHMGLQIIRPNGPVTNVNVLDSTTITATFPNPLIEGPYNILITNPAGEKGILNNGYQAIGPSSANTDIKANNSDGPLVINEGDTLNLTISLNPGEAAGYESDWWVYGVSDAIGTYWFQNGSGWKKSDIPLPAYEGPLSAVTNYNILETLTLPTGVYDFYFEVDEKNGLKEGTVTDKVNVTIQ
ncbi:MAG: hypothetical protein OEV42_12900 [Deltaproteobacteria bacterium]|nr:hypothetical protein [Deltaproteobacteria bacterium]